MKSSVLKSVIFQEAGLKKGKSLLLIAAIALIAYGGEFRIGSNKPESVSLTIPRSPDAVVKAKSLGMRFESNHPKFSPRLQQLGQFIRQDLSKEFDFSNAAPDAALLVSIQSYEPVQISEQKAMENRTINTGTSQKPNFEQRSVEVVYRLVHGSLTAGVFMTDKANQQLDSFTAKAEINRKDELSVNGQAPQAQASTADWNVLKGIKKPTFGAQKKEEGPHIVTAESLETEMLQNLASKIRNRYVATTDSVEIFLAVDPELKLGDKLAESGQWKEALDSWTAADMKKNPADRLYNMAVAKEALAYAEYAREQNLETFLPKFQESMDLYTGALHADPGEKYMRQAVDRLELAKANIDNVRKMEVDRQEQTARAAQQALANAQRAKLRDAALKDKTPDTQDEASFRSDVRTELRDVTGDVSDPKRDELVALGQKLGLSDLRSERVVLQEIDRKKKIGESLGLYENLFKSMVADGKITPAKRTRLREVAKKLDLDATDTKKVESAYHFQEAAGTQSTKPAIKKTAAGGGAASSASTISQVKQ